MISAKKNPKNLLFHIEPPQGLTQIPQLTWVKISSSANLAMHAGNSPKSVHKEMYMTIHNHT